MTVTSSDINLDDFGDFQAAVIALREQQAAIMNQLLRLAWIAVRNGWAATMAHLTGNSRTIIYDWALVWDMFGEVSPDVPLWLYVGSARIARQVAGPDRQKVVAAAILDHCEQNNITPSELLSMITKRGAVLPPITGRGTAEYRNGRIILVPENPPDHVYPDVDFVLRDASGEQEQVQNGRGIDALIRTILGPGETGS